MEADRRSTLISLAALLTVSGCNSWQELEEAYGGSDAGVVALSISAVEPIIHDQHILYYRNLSNGKVGAFHWISLRIFGSSDRDFVEPTYSGRVFYRSLQPGQYEFFLCRLGIIGEGVRWRVEGGLPIRFVINSHQTTYVGELRAVRNPGVLKNGIYYSGATSTPYFEVIDQSARDLPLIRAITKLPEPIYMEIPATTRRLITP